MEKLEDFLKAYQELNSEFDDFTKLNSIDDLITEKEVVTSELEQTKKEIKQLKSKLETEKDKAKKYKTAFTQKLLDEKITLLGKNQQRLKILINSKRYDDSTKLDRLDAEVKSTLIELRQDVGKENADFEKSLKADIKKLQNKIKKERQKIAEMDLSTKESLLAQSDDVHKKVAAKKIAPEVVKKEIENSQYESKLGLKGFNYVGIFFVFLALLTLGMIFARYINDVIPAGVKGASLFLIPVVMVLIGEYQRRKSHRIFGMGLVGGGIGSYYIVVFINYFILHCISGMFALVLLVFGSLLAVFLAFIYQELAIAILATIGGYIPIITYWSLSGMNNISLYVSELYVLLFNIFAVILFEKFKWRSHLVLTFCLFTPWLFIAVGTGIHSVLSDIIYSLLYVIVFSAMPIYKRIKHQEVDQIQEWLWMSSLIIYLNVSTLITIVQTDNHFMRIGLSIFNVLLVVTNFVLLQKGMSNLVVTPKVIISWILVNIMILYSAVITIPNQLFYNNESGLVSVGVLVLLYTLFAVRNSYSRMYRISAYVHYCLFYIYTIVYMGNYLLFVVGFVLMAAHYCWLVIGRKQLESFERMILNIVFYLHLNWFIVQTLDYFKIYDNWIIIFTLLITVIVTNFWNNFKKFFLPEILFGVVSLSVMFYWNFLLLDNLSSAIFSVVSNLIIVVLFVILARENINKERISQSIAIIIVTVIALFSTSVLTYVNCNFEYLTVILDVLYGLVALGYIMYGLRSGDALLRKIGLVFMLLVMAKMLLLDMGASTLVQRFVTFLIFGILALGVSYLYQRAINKLDKKETKKTK